MNNIIYYCPEPVLNLICQNPVKKDWEFCSKRNKNYSEKILKKEQKYFEKVLFRTRKKVLFWKSRIPLHSPTWFIFTVPISKFMKRRRWKVYREDSEAFLEGEGKGGITPPPRSISLQCPSPRIKKGPTFSHSSYFFAFFGEERRFFLGWGREGEAKSPLFRLSSSICKQKPCRDQKRNKL